MNIIDMEDAYWKTLVDFSTVGKIISFGGVALAIMSEIYVMIIPFVATFFYYLHFTYKFAKKRAESNLVSGH